VYILKKILFISCVFLFIGCGDEVIIQKKVLLDDKTSLMWQDNIYSTSIFEDWGYANQYCTKLSLEGFDNWRLPTKIELLTTINRKSINPVSIFENIVNQSQYWTSSYISNRREQIVVIYDNVSSEYHKNKNGYTIPRHVILSAFVRCVRITKP
jgi:hypothetical protein